MNRGRSRLWSSASQKSRLEGATTDVMMMMMHGAGDWLG